MKDFLVISSTTTYKFLSNVSRRKELVEAIKINFPQHAGVVVLFAAFELGSERFKQIKHFITILALKSRAP